MKDGFLSPASIIDSISFYAHNKTALEGRRIDMAQVTPISRHLQLQFQIGTTASGEPKLQNRNYANVSPSASDDDVLAVGQALAGLIAGNLYQVAKVDASGLSASATTTTP